MSIEVLHRSFFAAKQQYISHITSTAVISSREELDAPLELVGRMESMFTYAQELRSQIEEQHSHILKIPRTVKVLSLYDFVAFAMGACCLGWEYFRDSSTPWLKEAAIACFVASQMFAKYSQHTALKGNKNQAEHFKLQTLLKDVLTEELFVKLSKSTCSLQQGRELLPGNLQDAWASKRDLFLAALQGEASEMVEIDVASEV